MQIFLSLDVLQVVTETLPQACIGRPIMRVITEETGGEESTEENGGREKIGAFV